MKQVKRLYRSRNDKMIAGVCGGIAEYFDIDPVIVRLVTVLLLFANGIGLIMYIIAWIFVPENPEQQSTKKTTAEKAVKQISRHPRDGSVLIGMVLLVIGALLLINNLFSWFSFSYVWAFLLVVLGIYMLMRRSK
jgi:phage shock protein C